MTVPRAETIREEGSDVPPALGLGTAINFQAAGGGKAAITGDFVLTAREVVPVQRALVENGIEVTAIHNHMLGEEPRLFFMHFWAVDDAEKLARGLRAAHRPHQQPSQRLKPSCGDRSRGFAAAPSSPGWASPPAARAAKRRPSPRRGASTSRRWRPARRRPASPWR